MSRVCEICGKKTEIGRTITRRGLAKKKGGIGKKVVRTSLRKFRANLQNINVIVKGTPTRMLVCTRCIRSGKITKNV